MFARVIRSSVAAVALVAGGATVAQAQFLTDAGSPLGGGGGASGSVAGYASSGGLLAARRNFLGLFGAAGGLVVPNPAGGPPVLVPAASAAAIRNAVSAPNAASASALGTALGGSSQATVAANAFVNLAANPTPATLLAAITAYNTLVDVRAPGDPTVLGLREAIKQLGMLP